MDEKMKGIIHVRIDDRMIHGQVIKKEWNRTHPSDDKYY